ncbi:VVA0879 family protein [Streptomyces sp. ST2-7A]|uniref:VVA0879 family protein n=1 Tax=Streptomyces sp. ST2-7A TaxID=2907214 RepID=UPI001F334C21|nr:VVA0879 family protein [Streptomyces sp. ST2-7A]MCE7081203.1 hypothetical protein [Streptomyces sp. ST2-7A]
MNTRTRARTLTQAELHTEAEAVFGENPLDWAFVCPSCGDTATGHDFRAALRAHPRTDVAGGSITAGHLLGRECIGRTLGALEGDGRCIRGCDWAAYGLLSGPWTILFPGGEKAHAFPLARGKAVATSDTARSVVPATEEHLATGTTWRVEQYVAGHWEPASCSKPAYADTEARVRSLTSRGVPTDEIRIIRQEVTETVLDTSPTTEETDR